MAKQYDKEGDFYKQRLVAERLRQTIAEIAPKAGAAEELDYQMNFTATITVRGVDEFTIEVSQTA